MNKDSSRNVCFNCKYFQRYYIVSHDCRFKPTAAGFCAHTKINYSTAAKHVRKNEGCELWQPYELQKLETQYRMETALERIQQSTSDILALLRDME